MGLGLTLADGAWLGHLSFLLLALALLMPSPLGMRGFVIAASVVGMIFAFVKGHDFGLMLWFLVLLIISLAMLTRYLISESKAKFSEAEEALRNAFMPGLGRAASRHLIDQGNWINGRAGETLIEENKPVSHLFFLHEGEAQVESDGKSIAKCGAGELIGDVTVLSGHPASGTVTISTNSYFWCISADTLREYLTIHPEVRNVVERRIIASLDSKLRAANKRLSDD